MNINQNNLKDNSDFNHATELVEAEIAKLLENSDDHGVAGLELATHFEKIAHKTERRSFLALVKSMAKD